MNTLELAKRLKEHALGPFKCNQCSNNRNLWNFDVCLEEGQCDWNMHNGFHTDRISNAFGAKKDMLEAAKILEQY